MAANPLTVVTNDERAARVTGFARHEMQEAQAGSQDHDKVIEDEDGLVVAFGRGTTDPLVTYVALVNTNSDIVYISPNAAGDGINVSTTRP